MHRDALEQLLAAVRHDDADRVADLLLSGAPVNGRDDSLGATPLHVAAEHSCHAALRVLLARGADPDQEARGLTPLGLAVDVMIDSVCQNGGQPDPTAVDLLLRAGANPRAGTTSALDVAKGYGSDAHAEFLRRCAAISENYERSQ